VRNASRVAVARSGPSLLFLPLVVVVCRQLLYSGSNAGNQVHVEHTAAEVSRFSSQERVVLMQAVIKAMGDKVRGLGGEKCV